MKHWCKRLTQVACVSNIDMKQPYTRWPLHSHQRLHQGLRDACVSNKDMLFYSKSGMEFKKSASGTFFIFDAFGEDMLFMYASCSFCSCFPLSPLVP